VDAAHRLERSRLRVELASVLTFDSVIPLRISALGEAARWALRWRRDVLEAFRF